MSIYARRHFASFGLLLAFSLEVCGCNPAAEIGLSFDPPAKNPVRRDVAPSGSGLSFYDPTEPEIAAASSLLTISDPPTDPPSIPSEPRPLTWAIPESVYFVYRGRSPNDRPDAPQPHQPPVATAFVLSIPNRDHNQFIRFLVTARHVVDPQWAQCSQQDPASIELRLNRRSGGVGYETVLLRSGANQRFYTPTDPTVDLAVIPLNQNLIANLDEYKFIDVPFRLLPTDNEMRLILPDQQVMTARFSSRPAGEPGRYPVFGAGFLSKMPTEPVGVSCGIPLRPQSPAKLLHVWFIDAEVPQGVSGAPVYASISRGPGSAKTPILIGIQSVAWPDNGVAGITPSPALGDLIQSALHKSRLSLDFYKGPKP